ncbi:thiol:disulfide interchange protein DsbA/DsbL [Solilutibacter silvestris]|uniref:Thioredoxin n=1 Tax=Solilutibacter silvestris TaxID=1645665 RepID=A0A2K1Q1M2_9GAMM|nr:thiol:disulfide interchange protein DsbA/DsbL [Lysobacter silvestris]PNS08936.1 Thioredoxin [Lysobacter silvestris]
MRPISIKHASIQHVQSFLITSLLALCASLPANAATAAAAPLVQGTDYDIVAGAQPWQTPKKGEVEVVEVYAWWCPHCAHFAPMISAWASRQPAWVRMVYLPSDPDGTGAAAAFAAKRAGVFARVHPAMFRAVHDDHSMPARASIEEYAAFMAPFGSTPGKLMALMQSPEVAADLKRDRAFLLAAQIDGTPTLLVNGKYKILGRSFEEELVILDRLIAQIHGGTL